MPTVPCPSDRELPHARVSRSQRVFAALTALVARTPLRVGYAIANSLAWAHYLLFPARRRALAGNLAVMLERASPRERRAVARRVMASYNRMLFEFFRLPVLSAADLLAAVEVVGHEHMKKALELNRGVILTSSHIGNWELGAVALAHLGHRVHAVAGVQLGRWLTSAVRDAKQELAVFTVAPDDSFRKLFRALAHNDIVALMVDGDIFSNGVPVPFFGRTANWPAGPGALAHRTGAPVVCGYCERIAPGSFRIKLEPALYPAAFATAEELNAAIARTTERHIAEHVDQWCIFRPFWDGDAATRGAHDASTRRAAA